MAILDADKEGFLRSERSLIQTIGRAARNLNGRGDSLCRPPYRLDRAGDGRDRPRRQRSDDYNAEHGIVPSGVIKQISDMIDGVYDPDQARAGAQGRRAGHALREAEREVGSARNQAAREGDVEHARNLEFEQAARVRDQLMQLKATVFGGGATGPDTITGAAVESTGRVA